jgi:hypothetical protein
MQFSDFGSRKTIAAFDGGEITSDAGILLLREAAQRLNLFSRLADCFEDHRDGAHVRHSLADLLNQRVSAMTLGYEDLNDHDALRHDPALRLLGNPDNPALAASATLGRLEHSREAADPRYNPFVPKLKKLQNLLVDLYLDSHDSPPDRITLDIDATDIETHGHQEGGFFHGYYEHRCFLPLYVTCGPHLLLAQLRPGNIDAAQGARNVIKRMLARIRSRWPDVKILLRGDSGFVRENLVHWCEQNRVDYIFGLARNKYLLHKARKTRSRAALEMVNSNAPVEMFGHFSHRPRSKTWAKPRQVVCKVLHRPGQEQRVRFLVTSLDWNNDWAIPEMRQFDGKDALPRALYQNIYCPRGDMENRIKDCQLDLFGKRASAHCYRANQLRLLLAGFAYVLMTQLREKALSKTGLAKAAPNTIRLKLLKVGARVITSLRRIKISMPDAYPYKDAFFKAWSALAPT